MRVARAAPARRVLRSRPILRHAGAETCPGCPARRARHAGIAGRRAVRRVLWVWSLLGNLPWRILPWRILRWRDPRRRILRWRQALRLSARERGVQTTVAVR